VIIQKAGGANLYATSDLARRCVTAMNNCTPTACLVLCFDQRQAALFSRYSRLPALAGFVPETMQL